MSAQQKIFICVDGSNQAKHAFDWYLENVYRDGHFVLIAHCPEMHVNFGLPGANPDVEKINQYIEDVKKKSQAVDELTNSYMDILRARKIPSKIVLVQDKPGEGLAKAAKEEGAAQIIMGTRGLGTIRRTLLGSVSEYLVHHCDCPITVVRDPSQ